jgi:RimJ/RimL family protein N-acetyltransferase
MNTAETPRLLLRQFRADDLDAYARICADPEVMRWVGGQTFSRAEAWRHMAYLLGHWHLRGYGLWAVEEKASGRLIGRIGLYQPEGWPGLEVGWLLERAAWGQGYATEGGHTALEHGFRTLSAERIVSVIHVQNKASMQVAERLGERFERHVEVSGFPCALYAITRAEWERRSSAEPRPREPHVS